MTALWRIVGLSILLMRPRWDPLVVAFTVGVLNNLVNPVSNRLIRWRAATSTGAA